MMDELLSNCTTALAAETGAGATCMMCEECALKMSVSQMAKYMDTSSASVCASMTGLSCEAEARLLSGEVSMLSSKPKESTVLALKQCT